MKDISLDDYLSNEYYYLKFETYFFMYCDV